MSRLSRCPNFPGQFTCKLVVTWGPLPSVLITEVSWPASNMPA